jgi:hypothetical protein
MAFCSGDLNRSALTLRKAVEFHIEAVAFLFKWRRIIARDKQQNGRNKLYISDECCSGYIL